MRKRLPWLMAMLFGSVWCPAQRVTIHGKAMPITEVFNQIHAQTGDRFFYNAASLRQVPAVDLSVRNADVSQVLNDCFAGLNIDYHIGGKTVRIFARTGDSSLFLPVRGYVRSANGELLAGAIIHAEGGSSVVSGPGGQFNLPVHAVTTTVDVSYPDHVPYMAHLDNLSLHAVELQPAPSLLDVVIVKGYGKMPKRLATESISPVDSSIMEVQGTGNPLEALEGRVPGMVIQRINGVPGSAYQVSIRGRRSISQGTNPLIVVDGIPIADDAGYLGTIGSGSAQGPMGASFLNGIPASAIAGIQVLKDAAATAIYGSRGANGVLLVTLRSAVPGKLQWGADVSSGATETVKTSPLMNTAEYLRLREEAVRNDGLQAGPNYIPELLWDTTRTTNFQRAVTGHSGVLQQCQVSLTGGDSLTSFLVSGSYYDETAVYPGASHDNRVGVYGRLHHQFKNRRLTLDLSTLIHWEDNLLPTMDLTSTIYLAPNAPAFRNAEGQLQWSSDNVSYLNLPALGSNTYRGSVNHQYNHIEVAWSPWPELTLRSSLGYYSLAAAEHSQTLIAGQDPAYDPTGQTNYSNKTQHSELFEETADFTRDIKDGRLNVLVGITWQGQQTDSDAVVASNYTSDLLLATGGGNPTINSSRNSMLYRYEAIFGRLNYVYRYRYILELSGRRDGSSRFGPGHQWGNFWAASGAWVFGNEAWFRRQSWLSFGKLRGSIGTTGNDQIGENNPTPFYEPINTAQGYQTLQGVIPYSYANNQLQWEVNYNSELTLDLGFLHNSLVLSVAGYRDWTANQLVGMTVPSQSGLPVVFSNQPANVINEGLEFTLEAALKRGSVTWTATATLSMPVNRLERFPGLANSAYSQTLVVGKSLTVLRGYHYEGVDPDSGLYTFKGMAGNGTPSAPNLVTGGNDDPHYYGGVGQQLRYRCIELDIFFEYRFQSGLNPYVTLYQYYPPGFQGYSMEGNGPVQWLQRWQRPGDHAPIQKLTESYASTAYTRIQYYIASDAKSIAANYIRWKSCQLTYHVQGQWLQRWKITECKLYLEGQNLLTLTHYPVTDPETQDPTVLPPLRSVRAGIKLNV